MNFLRILEKRCIVLLVRIIRLYQHFLSRDHSIWARVQNRPPYCKHIPSCSMYAIEALEKHGILSGMWLSFKRILRCNPWAKGGYDPVPMLKKKEDLFVWEEK